MSNRIDGYSISRDDLVESYVRKHYDFGTVVVMFNVQNHLDYLKEKGFSIHNTYVWDNEIMIFEAYKIFVYTDENGNKQAFVMKGDNYKTVEEILSILIKLNYIKDLLNGKEYESYNLSIHDSVMLFLNNLLSHFLPYESQDGELINIDLKQFNENKVTFDYFYDNNLVDNEMFNTNI